MNEKLELIRDKFYTNRKTLCLCIISAFVFGLIAHGYMFFNNSISHDSLNEFLATGRVSDHRIELGRIFVPLYRAYIGGIITAPWLMGTISLLCISASAFLISKIFKFKSEFLLVVTTGILTVNKTIIALLGTYIHDADCDMIALMLAVLSVYLLLKFKLGWVWGIIPLVITLGLYQSYISVAITLVLMACILKLLRDSKFKDVLCLLVKGGAMVLISALIYLGLILVTPYITGVEMVSNEYNSLNAVFALTFKELIFTVFQTYTSVILTLFRPFVYNLKLLNALFLLIYALILLVPAGVVLIKRKLKGLELLMAVLLVLLLPLAMDFSRILAANMSHELMHYAIWIGYIFALAVLFEFGDISVKTLLAVCVLITLFFNIRTANQLYVAKDLAYDSNLSLMTRVMDRLENNADYVSGESFVAIIGEPDYLIEIAEHSSIPHIKGFWNTTSVLGIAWSEYYESYFKNVLNVPVALVDNEGTEKLRNDERVLNMPCFPREESIQVIDNVFVVKMGD